MGGERGGACWDLALTWHCLRLVFSLSPLPLCVRPFHSYPDNMVADTVTAAAQVPAPVVAAPAPASAAPPAMSPTPQARSTPTSPVSPAAGEGMKIKCRLSIGQDETFIFGMRGQPVRATADHPSAGDHGVCAGAIVYLCIPLTSAR